ncbi:titin-like [Cottoperca gobio]|uniref:Titin-like n=1 Tax=Cottoperca gobio TaxID=56716 RepID=A0A6J2QD62_COTGO|nr:titin-like [Cottoperca gobio]
MKFPVDLLADVSQAELERLAHSYMNNLLYSNPDFPEQLRLSDSTQVTIDISSVGFVPLYGSSDKQKILALFSPTDPFTAVALFLLDQWWPVDDILKTTDPARDGALEVETIGERIVLYILNRVVYRTKEMSSEELPFLCHGEKDHAKILWSNGEAVGFYSVKPSGSFSNSFSTRSYQLPVMDSIYVRKGQRGKGFGLQMLEDFVFSFKDDCLGLRYPLTKPMYRVCGKYLCQYPGHTELLWEVESIGGPNQRTNISSRIQAMDQSAVSKSLSFTEESLEITEMTEEDEEVTVLSATKETEVPLTARGRSSGSKRRMTGQKIAEDMSEKVIRIEDIEAETPREEQVSSQQKTDLHVSESLQIEGMFSVAPEEQEQDVIDTAATMLDQQELEEADVTSAPATEEPQEEEDASQDLNNSSCDSQIAVENVASGIEEECQKEDTTVLVVYEEVHKEAETLEKVGEGTQIGVTDEKLAERVTQHEESLSTCAASENGEAGKTGGTAAKAIEPVQSKTPRRKSTRHNRVEKETTAQDQGIILRGRTVMNASKTKRKYTRSSQKVCEEVDDVSTPKVVEELSETEGEEPEEVTSIKEDEVAVEELTEEKQQLEDEQVTNEEKTEKQQQPEVEDPAVKGTSTELPHTADTALTKEHEDEKVTDECEKEQMQNKQDVSDDEIEEPPVVHKRAFRGRYKVSPRPTKQSLEKPEGKHTNDANLGAGSSAEEQKAEEQATDKPMEEQEETNQTEEEISTVVEEKTTPKAEEAAEDVTPSTEVNVEESKEVHGEETVSVMEAEKEEEAVSVTGVKDDMTQEPDTIAASETVVPDKVPSEAEEPQVNNPKLQNVTVILVDIKTTCHHLSAKEAEEAPVDGERAAPKKQQEEEGGWKQENITDWDEEKGEAEEALVIETREEKTVEASCKSTSGSKQQQEEDNLGEDIIAKEVEEAETGTEEVEGEMEVEAKDAVTVTVPVESAVCGICADREADIPVGDDAEENLPPAEVDEAMSLEEEEVPVVETRALRRRTKTSTATPKRTTKRSSKEVDSQEAENCEEVEPAVTTRKLRRGRISPPSEEEATPSAEEQHSEEMAAQLSDLQVTPAHDAQEEMAAAEDGLPVQKTAEAEEEPKEETLAQENVPVGIETTELEKVMVEEEGFEDKVEAVTIQDTVGGEQSEGADRSQEPLTAEDDEAKSVSEEEEAPVIERDLRSGEKTVRVTTRRKTTKRQHDEQEEEVTPEESTEEDEPAVETRVLRKGRKSAAATPARTSKRARTQRQKEEESTPLEETEQEEEAGQEEVKEEGKSMEMEKDKEVEEAEQVKEEAAVPEQDNNSVEAVDEMAISSAEVEETNAAEEEETTVIGESAAATAVGSDHATAEEEALVEEASAVTRALRSKKKTLDATPSQKPTRQKDQGDSPRRSVRKRPRVDYRENEDEAERGVTDKERKVQEESDKDKDTKEAESSADEPTGKLNLELDTDEEVETAAISQEEEEDEQNVSEEEVEHVVTGKRVLRGRSVPSVIITTPSRSRRCSAKVETAEESEDEKKRRGTEVTSTRKSKRLSRV